MAKRKRVVHADAVADKKMAIAAEPVSDEYASLPDIDFHASDEADEEAFSGSEATDSGDENASHVSDIEMDEDVVNELMHRERIERMEAQTKVSQLYKAPTADEMHELKDTEELFKSNLFKWQIDEVLKEMTVKKEKCAGLEKMLWRLKDVFEQMVDQPEADVRSDHFSLISIYFLVVACSCDFAFEKNASY